MTDISSPSCVVRIGGATVSAEAQATRETYAACTSGSPERCGCLHCRNFAAARDQIYTGEGAKLLNSLGIDAHKEAEIYYHARLKSGLVLYGGWFHFVGTLRDGIDAVVPLASQAWTLALTAYTDHLRFGITCSPQLIPEPFKGKHLLQLDFEAEVPWVLEEPFEGVSE